MFFKLKYLCRDVGFWWRRKLEIHRLIKLYKKDIKKRR